MKTNAITKTLLAALALVMGVQAAQAAYSIPKREFRSAWVATVWQLDWPGSTTSETSQKAQLDRILDSLKVNNFNAVNFQVRSMCDAMYASSYEPWSSYLTGTRGKAPNYDPLTYIVEGCHKRGMECHAWVNPYRFSTGSDWNTTQDQELKNNGWLLTYGSTIILDPAQQRTIDRIVAVCKEIITNYDVDGILYDDYFYPSGIPTTSDAGDYTEWQESGTSLSIGDWRRENVNKMVKAVYDMIQETRPEVRYGISPAGVAASSKTVAAKYGVDPCPSGSDWQYNSIFSDPLAWLSSQTIDYISPQVYWKIGASNDYSKITPWWGTVAAKFGRHVYISSSISSLTSSSTDTEYKEYADEVELNRTSSVDGSPGAIFYSMKYLYGLKHASLGNYLKRSVFTKPALVPLMTWKEGYNPGLVKNIELSEDGVLSWEGYENVRYTIYAFPETMNTATFSHQVDYLLGMSYETQFTLPSEYVEGYQYAVCVFDRVGNEYDAAFLSYDLKQLDAPVLIAPDAGATEDAPFKFVWEPVDSATTYVVEISETENFDVLLESHSTTDTTLSALVFEKLPHAEQIYWRVQSKASKCYSGISETRLLTPMLLTITNPEDGSEELDPNITATWYRCHSDSVATLEIANDAEFADIVFMGNSATGELDIPSTTFEPGNTYYMRVKLTVNGETMISKTVAFTTAHAATVFTHPLDGGIVVKGEHLVLRPQNWAESYVIEVSSSATTWGRTRFIETVKDGAYQTTLPADSIKVSSKYLVDGTTYYARTKTNYTDFDGNSKVTAYGDVISFTYYETAPTAETGDVNADGEVNIADVNALISIILGNSTEEDYAGVADVNGDAEINIADVNAVIAIILGN